MSTTPPTPTPTPAPAPSPSPIAHPAVPLIAAATAIAGALIAVIPSLAPYQAIVIAGVGVLLGIGLIIGHAIATHESSGGLLEALITLAEQLPQMVNQGAVEKVAPAVLDTVMPAMRQQVTNEVQARVQQAPPPIDVRSVAQEEANRALRRVFGELAGVGTGTPDDPASMRRFVGNEGQQVEVPPAGGVPPA